MSLVTICNVKSTNTKSDLAFIYSYIIPKKFDDEIASKNLVANLNFTCTDNFVFEFVDMLGREQRPEDIVLSEHDELWSDSKEVIDFHNQEFMDFISWLKSQYTNEDKVTLVNKLLEDDKTKEILFDIWQKSY